jgi:membrane-associated phospholipid phosphatase
MRALLTPIVVLIAVTALAAAPSSPTAADGAIEPTAGTWRTWVIGPPRALRSVPPPSHPVSRAELAELRKLAAQRDIATRNAITYWDTGPPSYRWSEIAVGELLRSNAYTNVAARDLALLHVALHDALVAAWETKYAYRRPRPSEIDRRLVPAVAVPRSPSYPAEHAVAAGAASAILAYLYPDRAASYTARAEEAARSRMLAGVNYASDVRAGLALGRAVAARVIERGRADGSDRPWTGRVPAGAGRWTGVDPIQPQAATWRPWVLRSPDELRPPPPPAHDSSQLVAEMDELRRFLRTSKTDADALFWEYAAGGRRSFQFWSEVLGRAVLEYRLHHNAPRAARAYAVTHVAFHDAAIACWDAKYAYWAIRPAQLDPGFRPLFTTPNHPSYPSGHSCFSSAAATALGHLFPRDVATFERLATDASESRLWAGIHFRSDLTAGRTLGRDVAYRVIQQSEVDGTRWPSADRVID